MLDATIHNHIHTKIPNLTFGMISYHHIAIGASPQMIQGRIRYFQEVLAVNLEEQELTDFEGISAWREIFKTLGISPSRYRPSQEALYRRIKKGGFLEAAHSAIDLNNFFSLEYQIPIGIYDAEKIDGPVEFKIGEPGETYDGLNGRSFSAEGKLITTDQSGAFGSPIVDSTRTSVSTDTTEAIQIFYLNPALNNEEANQLLERAAQMFTQVHGGHAEWKIVGE
ncbi:B3/B4 domain-containing protein [Alkalicoccobacillus murimartini]|uniref:DNA/RNA-binding domain of Phe-tRNA-synthetase-like protein n=1 Tax=Alkalicoccobacillus murimartini TaxID=171685 RepID=A0ABT9YCJ8_9BACI|nr:phenylalanine--tRNA ligase beta subunit-related protein [Alkalicoccobacillus murimartini]MDQ0205246.1 DNA/RNA-binding domain of Phe-tRNA-synthetase-like protein [Alkalicoccobacillus murimartini]